MAFTSKMFNAFLSEKIVSLPTMGVEFHRRLCALDIMENSKVYRPFELSERLERKLRKKMQYFPKKESSRVKYLLNMINLLIENGIRRGPGNLIIKNVPLTALDVDLNECPVTAEILYNSLTHVAIPIEWIHHIDDGMFVIKCPTKEDAQEAVKRLNKTLLGGNIIQVSYNEILEKEIVPEGTTMTKHCNMLSPLMFLALFLFVWIQAWGFLWN